MEVVIAILLAVVVVGAIIWRAKKSVSETNVGTGTGGGGKPGDHGQINKN